MAINRLTPSTRENVRVLMEKNVKNGNSVDMIIPDIRVAGSLKKAYIREKYLKKYQDDFQKAIN